MTMDKPEITRYELPPSGISLLGYIVRRMHKTQWLMPVPVLVAGKHTEDALAHIAVYSALAATSFGKAYYQPRFNTVGEEVSEPDPETSAIVRAKLESSSPSYRISCSVVLPHGSLFTGDEEITGTTIGLRGLGMPAPSRYSFRSGNYKAELAGTLTSELAYALLSRPRIRAYGMLNFSDSTGNTGSLNLDRNQNIQLLINEKAWKVTAPYAVEPAVA